MKPVKKMPNAARSLRRRVLAYLRAREERPLGAYPLGYHVLRTHESDARRDAVDHQVRRKNALTNK